MKTWMFLLLLHLGICTAPTPTTSRQYHFISSPKSWTEAQSYCRATYTDLATVDNIEDLNQLLMSGSDPFGWIASSATKPEKQQHSAHSEDGRLFYDGEWYGRGQNICIDKKDKYPTRAVITTVNHEEVWFKRLDGSKSKLYISQLQKGKYTIKHS